jgi:signal transduction histidine kinase
MKRYLLVFISLVLISAMASAQLPDLKRYSTNEKKLKAIHEFCSKMLDKEHYDSLLIASRMGLKISLAMHNDTTTSIYYYYIGAGFASKANVDSSVHYYQLSESYGARTGIPDRVVNPQARILETLDGTPNTVLTEQYVAKLEAQLKKYQTTPRIVEAISSVLATAYTNRSQYEKALTYHFSALKEQQKTKDSTSIGTTYTNIGNVYILLGNFQKSLQYLMDALPYLEQYQAGKMICYFNIASCYLNLNKPVAAVQNLKKSLAIAKSFNNDDAIYAIEAKLGMAYLPQKQYQQAETSFMGAIKHAERVKDIYLMSDAYLGMGQVSAAKNNYAVAVSWFNKSLAVATANKMIEREAEVYNSLANAASAAKKFDKAYEYHVKYMVVKDSLAKEVSKKNISQLETQFQTEKKVQQIKLLDQKQKAQSLELQAQRRTKYFLIIAIVFVLIIIGLTLRSYRIKQNANLALADKNKALGELNTELQTVNAQLDEANRSKAKLFGILSHDLRAPVSSLFQFLNLQKNYAGKLNEQQAQKHNLHIISSAETLMESMEDLLMWSKSQMDTFSLRIEEANAEDIIDDTISLHSNFANDKYISLKKLSIAPVIIKTDLNFLKIVLRNIISNGIKFTKEGGSITFGVDAKNDRTVFTINDTGIGMNPTQLTHLFEWNSIRSDTSGMGLRLAKEFTERLGGTINVASVPGEGTCFTVMVPNK